MSFAVLAPFPAKSLVDPLGYLASFLPDLVLYLNLGIQNGMKIKKKKLDNRKMRKEKACTAKCKQNSFPEAIFFVDEEVSDFSIFPPRSTSTRSEAMSSLRTIGQG